MIYFGGYLLFSVFVSLGLGRWLGKQEPPPAAAPPDPEITDRLRRALLEEEAAAEARWQALVSGAAFRGSRLVAEYPLSRGLTLVPVPWVERGITDRPRETYDTN